MTRIHHSFAKLSLNDDEFTDLKDTECDSQTLDTTIINNNEITVTATKNNKCQSDATDNTNVS